MSDFGDSSIVRLADLAVGDIIFAEVKISKKDMANPESKSETALKIVNDQPVERYCVVLSTEHNSVTVTYLATFARSKTFPSPPLDAAYWYPVEPATKEGPYNPLPALNTRAQWASLRTKQHVSTPQVTRYSVKCRVDAAGTILNAMKS